MSATVLKPHATPIVHRLNNRIAAQSKQMTT